MIFHNTLRFGFIFFRSLQEKEALWWAEQTAEGKFEKKKEKNQVPARKLSQRSDGHYATFSSGSSGDPVN